MHKVNLDAALESQLTDLTAEVEVCSQSGQTLGYFLPVPLYEKLLYAWAKTQFPDEELDRARRQSEAYTTAEVLEYLGKL